VRRIRFRDNWPVELWFVVAVVLFTLFVVVPWLVQHPLPDHPHVLKADLAGHVGTWAYRLRCAMASCTTVSTS
jgi:hypothetical protein